LVVAFGLAVGFGWPDHRGDVLYTSLLGPAGAVARLFLTKILNRRFEIPSNFRGRSAAVPWYYFPVGTFASNVLGCALVGSLTPCIKSNSTPWCSYVAVGVGGALSTVSSWVNDTFTLHGLEMYRKAYVYSVGSSIVGLGILLLAVKLSQ
jgi:fluoride ion exporter CrcB/FEX